MTQLIVSGDTIVCPRGFGSGTMLIDLKEIAKAEARTIEVQSVTPQKAPELLSTFTISWREIHQHVVFMMKERDDAERHLNKVKAIITLDKAPEALKKRGLAKDNKPEGTAELRNAIMVLDPDYDIAVENLAQIECVLELLKGKLKSMQMAYESVKKVLGGNGGDYLLNKINPNLNGDSGALDVGQSQYDDYSGFGKPR